MSWTAVVPLKPPATRKTRLAGRLDAAERIALGNRMAAHVIACLKQVPAIGRIIVLAPEPADETEWRRDEGRGLNAELAAVRSAIAGPLLVIHGDLPLVSPEDVAALLDAAGTGSAIAPDRHGSGTNALALGSSGPFAFAFGEDSFARHLAAPGAAPAVVRRPGLAIDVDTPEDLDAARAAGFGGAPDA